VALPVPINSVDRGWGSLTSTAPTLITDRSANLEHRPVRQRLCFHRGGCGRPPV